MLQVKFCVLTATSIKMPVFQDVSRPDDGDSKYLRNVGKVLSDYAAHRPRRLSSSEQTEPVSLLNDIL